MRVSALVVKLGTKDGCVLFRRQEPKAQPICVNLARLIVDEYIVRDIESTAVTLRCIMGAKVTAFANLSWSTAAWAGEFLTDCRCF